jgi:hypothetical protein
MLLLDEQYMPAYSLLHAYMVVVVAHTYECMIAQQAKNVPFSCSFSSSSTYYHKQLLVLRPLYQHGYSCCFT